MLVCFVSWDLIPFTPFSIDQIFFCALRRSSAEPHFVIKTTLSTVLPKTHKTPDSFINVTVNFGNSVGMLPLNSIVEKADAYKPKQRITYKLIKEYILEKYSFKVHTAYIAEVKRGLGLPMYDAPNAVETLKQPSVNAEMILQENAEQIM